MALAAELENLVKELEKIDPVAAKEQRALLEKHESLQKPLKEGVLRQNDYDRFMNDNKRKVETFDQTISDWKKAKSIHDQLLEDHRVLQEKATKLEADLQLKVAATAAAATGEDGLPKIDEQKLAQAVRDRIGSDYVSKADLDRIVKEESGKQYDAAKKEFFEKTFPEAANWISSMVDAQFSYHEEFGKRLDKAEFAKFLKENGIADPMKGYEKFVENARTEKKIEAEVEKRLAEKRKQDNLTEFPGSSGSPQPMGALQIRLKNRTEGDPLIPKDVELGDGSLANIAAQELRKEMGVA